MTRWGMVIDLDKCSACQACVVACQSENNVAPPNQELHEQGRSIHWIRVLPTFEGTFPHFRMRLFPLPCLHCDNPPCTKVCPVSATYKSEEGIIGQIFSRCIGCRYCTTACPYTVREFNWKKPVWPEEMKPIRNRDVSIRPKGVVEKCTLCTHRLQKGREKARVEGREMIPEDYIPACVEVCPSQAMIFGDLDDPESEVSKLVRSRRAFRLMEDLGTEPKVIYLSEGGGD
ncbi:MAG: 4Fe-4S dicluster domain-containing protein [Deltaproteobacteria bacterium]|nr:4Fe-4S dicluster domain-containing protein [Deltaproteobacteria bacterium]MBI2501014.1 4Fe-4S dicluster domain-containing protein [Deltaproteobacteria bacterium]MBI4196767.1 4Fe-4S dicluster domain-containing protein [Deltaproteobacteria bacterium]